MLSRFLLLGLILLLTSCTEESNPKDITAAIYHWKSTYEPSPSSEETLEVLKIKKRYLHFFDIDYDFERKEVIPKSVIRIKTLPEGNIIPVVFITNRTFKSIRETQIGPLAAKTASKVRGIAEKHGLSFNEVQVDCDWSKSTKSNYFSFLNALKTEFSNLAELSVTLRLHQIKFRELTGVPPVKKGALMLYNVGDFMNINTPNSLFDPDIIDQYIYRLPEYPLKLAIALPIFHQTVVYRNRKFETFFKNFSNQKLKEKFNLKASERGNVLTLDRDINFREHSFRKGDVFRYESVNFKHLNQVKEAILRRLPGQKAEIIFFHLDENSLDNFTPEQYTQLLSS
ncbi:MAG: hypothetical protein ACI9IP_000785 [Arcticibacterium sp.]|jgi:hypothetical protein